MQPTRDEIATDGGIKANRQGNGGDAMTIGP